jgi:protein-tyrosine phosphatase
MPDENPSISLSAIGVPATDLEARDLAASEAFGEEAGTPDAPAMPPALSGNALLGRGLVRWALMGGVRQLYRRWTRLAAHAFPEDSRRAALATRIGIPLPDSLNMSWITPHLAVGGRVHPDDTARLASTGVTRVVDTRSEHQDDERALAEAGIRLLHLPTPDTRPLTLAQLCEGAAWINTQINAGQRVLVHCEHGVGRSVLMTAAALVMDGMGAGEAIQLIQRKRWQAAPNHRQMRRLQEFERAVRTCAPG